MPTACGLVASETGEEAPVPVLGKRSILWRLSPPAPAFPAILRFQPGGEGGEAGNFEGFGAADQRRIVRQCCGKHRGGGGAPPRDQASIEQLCGGIGAQRFFGIEGDDFGQALAFPVSEWRLAP